MIKKIIKSIMVVAVMAFLLSVPAVANAEECYHWSDTITDTATLTKPGKATYTCLYCNKVVTEDTDCLLGQRLVTMQGYFWGTQFDAQKPADAYTIYRYVSDTYFYKTYVHYTDDHVTFDYIPYDLFIQKAKQDFAAVPDLKSIDDYSEENGGFSPCMGGMGDPDHVVYDRFEEVNGQYRVYGHWVRLDAYSNWKKGEDVCMVAKVNANNTIQVISYVPDLSKCSHNLQRYSTPATLTTDGKKNTDECTKCGKVFSSTPISRIASITLTNTEYVYSGSKKLPAFTVKDSKGTVITPTANGVTNFEVTWPTNPVNAGTYNVVFTFKGDYTGTVTKTYTIKPAAQKITAKVTSKTYKVKSLKKKKATFSIKAKAKTKCTYKSSKKKYITVTSTGKVTVKKGTPKGTYKITVTAPASKNYKKATKTIKIKVVK